MYEDRFCNSLEDNQRLENGLIYKTKEEAIRYANYQKAKKEYTYKFSKEEWDNISINKWTIIYTHDYKKLETAVYSYAEICGVLYFKTKEQVQEFIDKYRDEILEYEFGIVGD